MATQIEKSQQLSSPAIENALNLYGPKLTGILTGTIDPTKFAGDKFTAGQNVLQQEAAKQAFAQQGYDVNFNALTGKPTISGDGIAGFQSFLDDAGSAAGQIQGAGLGALQQAGQQLGQAGIMADAAQQAAFAGQGAGAANIAQAQSFVGPQAYQQFMTPYQQEVIDTTMADLQQQNAEQMAQFGSAAGNAFGGSRFGVAQGQLAADANLGTAKTLADLRERMFTNAQQAASNAGTQSLNIATAAQKQAQDNQALFGTALQGQAGLAASNQGLAAAQMSPFQNALAGNLQIAQATPQLEAQQFGVMSAFGDTFQNQMQNELDAQAALGKAQQYAPYEQLGFVGDQITGLMGGYKGGTTVGSTETQLTGMEKGLGAGMVGSGILANLGSLFGN